MYKLSKIRHSINLEKMDSQPTANNIVWVAEKLIMLLFSEEGSLMMIETTSKR